MIKIISVCSIRISSHLSPDKSVFTSRVIKILCINIIGTCDKQKTVYSKKELIHYESRIIKISY